MNFKKYVGNILLSLGIKKYVVLADLSIRSFFRKRIQDIRFFYIPLLIRIRSKRGDFAVCLNSSWLGLGARIVLTLEMLYYCNENNLKPYIRYGYKKKSEPDYFGELFLYKNTDKLKSKSIKYTKIRHTNELGLNKNYNDLLTITKGKELLNDYLTINPKILSYVNNYLHDNQISGDVLGLHYRGTDKAGEAPRVEYEYVLKILRDELKLKSYNGIFVSSDEYGFIEFIKNNISDIRVFYHNDHYRSNNGEQFHRVFTNDIALMNREAFINCLILASCTKIIKTASILSDCCKIFNPNLDMVILNEPHCKELLWWPASELNVKYLKKVAN